MLGKQRYSVGHFFRPRSLDTKRQKKDRLDTVPALLWELEPTLRWALAGDDAPVPPAAVDVGEGEGEKEDMFRPALPRLLLLVEAPAPPPAAVGERMLNRSADNAALTTSYTQRKSILTKKDFI